MQIEDVLNMKIENPVLLESLKKFGLKGDLTYKDALYVSMIQGAIKGDVKSALYLLENADVDKDSLENTLLGDIQKKRSKKNNVKNRKPKSKN